MAQQEMHKPGIETWLATADAIADRLTNCVHMLKSPPSGAAFMPDAERQQKAHEINAFLHRLHPLMDKGQMPDEYMRDLHLHDEQVIDGLNIVFADILKALPRLSADMQTFLNSPWTGKFPHQAAHDLFAGDGDIMGIGSGHPEQGHLPAALAALAEREAMGDTRGIRKPVAQLSEEPQRHDPAPRRRVSTAGRME